MVSSGLLLVKLRLVALSFGRVSRQSQYLSDQGCLSLISSPSTLLLRDKLVIGTADKIGVPRLFIYLFAWNTISTLVKPIIKLCEWWSLVQPYPKVMHRKGGYSIHLRLFVLLPPSLENRC